MHEIQTTRGLDYFIRVLAKPLKFLKDHEKYCIART